jgi:[ribosomal protein S18]-alanine N-acetyltransferase
MLERARIPEAASSYITVRPATTADVDRIIEIERASFSDPWSRRAFQALVGDRRVLFAVACLPDGVVAGYVVAWFIAEEGEIANLAVAPEARGRHLGSLLLDSVIRTARTRGVSSIYLEVRDSNEQARALYGSRGFVQIGRRSHYYRRPTEDALVLRLVLPAT